MHITGGVSGNVVQASMDAHAEVGSELLGVKTPNSLFLFHRKRSSMGSGGDSQFGSNQVRVLSGLNGWSAAQTRLVVNLYGKTTELRFLDPREAFCGGGASALSRTLPEGLFERPSSGRTDRHRWGQSGNTAAKKSLSELRGCLYHPARELTGSSSSGSSLRAAWAAVVIQGGRSPVVSVSGSASMHAQQHVAAPPASGMPPPPPAYTLGSGQVLAEPAVAVPPPVATIAPPAAVAEGSGAFLCAPVHVDQSLSRKLAASSGGLRVAKTKSCYHAFAWWGAPIPNRCAWAFVAEDPEQRTWAGRLELGIVAGDRISGATTDDTTMIEKLPGGHVQVRCGEFGSPGNTWLLLREGSVLVALCKPAGADQFGLSGGSRYFCNIDSHLGGGNYNVVTNLYGKTAALRAVPLGELVGGWASDATSQAAALAGLLPAELWASGGGIGGADASKPNGAKWEPEFGGAIGKPSGLSREAWCMQLVTGNAGSMPTVSSHVAAAGGGSGDMGFVAGPSASQRADGSLGSFLAPRVRGDDSLSSRLEATDSGRGVRKTASCWHAFAWWGPRPLPQRAVWGLRVDGDDQNSWTGYLEVGLGASAPGANPPSRGETDRKSNISALGDSGGIQHRCEDRGRKGHEWLFLLDGDSLVMVWRQGSRGAFSASSGKLFTGLFRKFGGRDLHFVTNLYGKTTGVRALSFEEAVAGGTGSSPAARLAAVLPAEVWGGRGNGGANSHKIGGHKWDSGCRGQLSSLGREAWCAAVLGEEPAPRTAGAGGGGGAPPPVGHVIGGPAGGGGTVVNANDSEVVITSDSHDISMM